VAAGGEGKRRRDSAGAGRPRADLGSPTWPTPGQGPSTGRAGSSASSGLRGLRSPVATPSTASSSSSVSSARPAGRPSGSPSALIRWAVRTEGGGSVLCPGRHARQADRGGRAWERAGPSRPRRVLGTSSTARTRPASTSWPTGQQRRLRSRAPRLRRGGRAARGRRAGDMPHLLRRLPHQTAPKLPRFSGCRGSHYPAPTARSSARSS
jgi:hypothetical protein